MLAERALIWYYEQSKVDRNISIKRRKRETMPEKKKDKEPEEKDLSETRKPVFVWKSADFVQYDRSNQWYTTVVLATAAVAALLVWQQIWTGVILVVVAALIMLISSRLKPREVKCAVFTEGIVVDERSYEYGQFKSFWINAGELPKLVFQRVGKIAGVVEIPLQNVDIDQVRLYISKHLPQEDDQGENLVDRINRMLRF